MKRISSAYRLNIFDDLEIEFVSDLCVERRIEEITQWKIMALDSVVTLEMWVETFEPVSVRKVVLLSM